MIYYCSFNTPNEKVGIIFILLMKKLRFRVVLQKCSLINYKNIIISGMESIFKSITGKKKTVSLIWLICNYREIISINFYSSVSDTLCTDTLLTHLFLPQNRLGKWLRATLLSPPPEFIFKDKKSKQTAYLPICSISCRRPSKVF